MSKHAPSFHPSLRDGIHPIPNRGLKPTATVAASLRDEGQAVRSGRIPIVGLEIAACHERLFSYFDMIPFRSKLLFLVVALAMTSVPFSRAAEEPPKKTLFLPKSPVAAAYVLARLSNKELIEAPRSEFVYVALLQRAGLDRKYRLAGHVLPSSSRSVSV